MNKKMFLKLLGNIWKTVWEQVKTSFRFRVTGGEEENIKLPGYNGRAKIDKIYGNTVKWNQLVQNGDFSNGSSGWSLSGVVTSISVLNKKCSFTKSDTNPGYIYPTLTISSNHIYYYTAFLSIDEYTASGTLGIGFVNSTNTNYGRVNYSSTVGHKTSGIYKVLSSDNIISLCIRPSNAFVGTCSVWNVNVVDLTQIFDTDTQIASALEIQEADITTDIGVAAFEKWLELNIGEQEYYPYDPGSLINFNGSGIKGVGFNLWDEQWEVGGIDPSTGANVANQTVMRSKNYIPCFPSTKYYFKGPTINFGGTRFYDLGMNYIGRLDSAVVSNSEFETPSNCRFIRIQSTVAYGPTYNNDLCINLSNLNKNGTYEPYWTDSSDLSFIYSIKDTNNNNILFPNGLCSAGSVYDEVTETQAIKRVGSVDLGTVSLSTSSSRAHTFGLAEPTKYGSNLIINKDYTNVPGGVANINVLADYCENNSITYGIATSDAMDNRIYIYNGNKTTAPTSQDNWLSGIVVYYELATPTIVPLTPEQRMRYKASKYGTEEVCYPIELEYIESTGTQWIDTGVKLSNKDAINTEFKILDVNSVGALYGVYSTSSNQGNTTFYCATIFYTYEIATTNRIVVAELDTNWHNLTTNYVNGKINFDNNEVSFTPQTFNNTVNNCIFTRYYNISGSEPYGYNLTGRIKHYIVYRDNIKILYLIPCLDPNGVVCMYDKVSRSFFYNQGTGDFIAGPIVSGSAPISTGIIADINYQHKGGYGNQPIELEYIESTEKQYIDTGLTAGSNTRILAQYKLKNTAFTFPILVRDENTAGAGFGVGTNGSQQFISDYNGDRQVFTTITPNTTDTITVDKNKNVCTITIGGQSETVTNAVSTFTTTNTLPFFATSSAGVVSSGHYVFYSFKMWNNDVLVRDLVPYIDQDGVVCMYDKVSRSFFYNQGTGDFIAGPAKDLPGGGV